MSQTVSSPGVQPIDASGFITRAISGGRSLVLTVDAGILTVRTKAGELLDPKAAEVIMALGGEEPKWLHLVEALQVVNASYPGSQFALVEAAEVVGRNPAVRGQLAKTSSNRVVLLALAAIGQAQVACNPYLDAAEWDLLLNHRDSSVQAKAWSLARVLPPSLADHVDENTRIRVAQNPDCPPKVLARLGRDKNAKVLMAAGANPSTPVKTLRRLARTPRQTFIRRSVAVNPSTPRWTLVRLVRDLQPVVRAAVVTNPSLPTQYARNRVGDASGTVRYAVAQRTDLGPHALSWLERFARRDGSRQYALTRKRLEYNPSCPPYLRKRLNQIDDQLHQATEPRRPLSKRTRAAIVFGALPASILGLFVGTALLIVGSMSIYSGRPSVGVFQMVSGLALDVMCVAFLIWFQRRSRPPGSLWRPPLPVQIARWVIVIGMIAGAAAAHAPGLLVLPLLLFGVRSTIVTRQRRAARQHRQ